MEFYEATAEQVLGAVRAVVIAPGGVDIARAADFLDTSHSVAQNALGLAATLDLLTPQNDGTYIPASPLSRYADSQNVAVRAAVLRIALEGYEPFRFFIDRIRAGDDPKDSAAAAVTLLGLDSHRDNVRGTLVDLGAYTQVLAQDGPGRVKLLDDTGKDLIFELAGFVHEAASAAGHVREYTEASQHGVILSDLEVVSPMATAMLRARDGDGEGAVHHAGNAVESFVVFYGSTHGVQLTQSGITSKVDYLRGQNSAALPKKLQVVGQFLGSSRNAADHGTDPDVNASWAVTPEFGRLYVSCALQFMRSLLVLTHRTAFEL